MEKLKALLLAVFGVRQFSNYQIIRFPPFIISGVLLALTFAAYLLGGVNIEYELRVSFLAAFVCSIPIVAFYFLNQTLSRWITIISVTCFVFWVAAIWKDAHFLYFLVIPVTLAAVLINRPAT